MRRETLDEKLARVRRTARVTHQTSRHPPSVSRSLQLASTSPTETVAPSDQKSVTSVTEREACRSEPEETGRCSQIRATEFSLKQPWRYSVNKAHSMYLPLFPFAFYCVPSHTYYVSFCFLLCSFTYLLAYSNSYKLTQFF